MFDRSGVRRFEAEVYRDLKDHFSGLAKSQSPSTLFVTCSDSRVDPSLITQTQPGELFVLRNVGNLVPAFGNDLESAAVVEYAVSVLQVRRIVVCGHSNCGAMFGLLNPHALESVPTVAAWLEHASPVRQQVVDVDPESRWDAAIRASVAFQVALLQTHPSVAHALSEGRLDIEGWVYDIGEGRVDFLTDSPIRAGAES